MTKPETNRPLHTTPLPAAGRCEIVHATSAAHIAVVRSLLQEYATETGLDLEFQNFAAELVALPGDYASPRGCLMLARYKNQWAGCVALRPLPTPDFRSIEDISTANTCEMKRMFVPNRFRGRGLGRFLAEALIQEARALGYAYMKLDTIEALAAANHLYRSLGFHEIAPYRHNPLPAARFFELKLAADE
ncbi:MAG: hypothetical protein JWN98_2667 [Abditibacteriota bacterium]|nr:hypothetical protein [Abditibacteriota bacterium]